MRHRLPRDIPVTCGRSDFVVARCHGKKVLHLGCVDEGLTARKIGDDTLMHSKLAAVAAVLWGVDISEEGLHLLKEAGFTNLIRADIEQMDTVRQLQNIPFDVIVATEVLEHLDSPGFFLRSVKALFSEETVLIVSVPNAYNFEAIHSMLGNVELVHPDHNYYFSHKTITTLFEKNGYRVVESAVYTWYDPAYSITRGGLLLLRSMLGWFLGRHARPDVPKWARYALNVVIRRILFKYSRHFAEGLIFVVKPKMYSTAHSAHERRSGQP